MSLPAGTSVINGFAVSPDGALYVTPSGTASITGGNTAFVLSRCSIPFVRSNTGNMGNNGAYVAGTAYTKTYPKCFMYFAAAQIAAGSAAGWYYAEGSSTTAFTVFNNTYTNGTPAVPTKVAFVTTGSGAITGDTTEQGALPTIAANQLGNSGWFRVTARFTNNNTAGNKTYRLRYSGLGGTQLVGQVNTTAIANGLVVTTMNAMATNSQESYGVESGSGSSFISQAPTSAADTTAATNPAITTQIAVATDWAVMEWYIVELMQDGT